MNANQEPRPTYLSQNQKIRNFRLSDCQEEATHGRTRSKAGKDAKEGKAQNPIERPDCTPQRATVILVVLMNPRHVMWCSQERAQSRCARIISAVEISSTKKLMSDGICGDVLASRLGPTASCSPPPIVSLDQLCPAEPYSLGGLPCPTPRAIVSYHYGRLIVLITLKVVEAAIHDRRCRQAPTPLLCLFFFAFGDYRTEHRIYQYPACCRYPDFVDRSLRSLPWPFSDGSGLQDY